MGNIYLLQLQQNKYYVGYTRHNKININSIRSNKWLRKYPPISILKYINTKKFRLDYHVRSFMMYYGIDNVRGGNYKKVKLRKKTIANIEEKTTNILTPKISILKICPECGANEYPGHQCPKPDTKFKYLLICLRCGEIGHKASQCFYIHDISGNDYYYK